jgi:putative Mg2+ transporter-C (MgtC) family protein
MLFDMTMLGSLELDITVKLLLAALAGALVGLEREKHGRPAGLRTNLLVAVGSCVMMIVSEAFYLKYGMFDAETTLRLDPSRVAAQIVTGIGFLGAGVILKEGATVRGLTTAASLWTVAGLGMAFGMGFFSLGAIATALVLVSLTFLKKLDPIIKKDRFLTLMVTASNREGLLGELQQLFVTHNLEVTDISSHVDLIEDELFYQMVITRQEQRVGHDLTAAIKQLDGIKKVHYH